MAVCLAAAAVMLLSLGIPRAAGDWALAKDLSACQRHLCTASNFTWEADFDYNPASGCAVLAHRGVTLILLYGDSFGMPLPVCLRKCKLDTVSGLLAVKV